MHLVTYLDFLQATEDSLAHSYRVVSDGHAADADVHWTTGRFADQCHAHAQTLATVLARRERADEPVPERLHAQALSSARTGPAGLLRDLQDLYQLTTLLDITRVLIDQAGQAARDHNLLDATARCATETTAQLAWLRMRMKAAAPQTLLVAT